VPKTEPKVNDTPSRSKKSGRAQLDLGLSGGKKGPERSLEVHCSNCGAKFTAYYGTDEEVIYTVHVSSCGLCQGDTFKRDCFKGCTIRLLAEVTRERAMTPSPKKVARAKFWQATTAYKLGDRAAIRVEGEVFILVCIQPGKSAITMPDLPRPGVSKIWDGLCVWEIEK
jgi:hypothetical protein